MKKALILVLLLISIKSFGQLNHQDLYIIKESNDMRLAAYVLMSYNNFSFDEKNVVHDDHSGWYKFSKGKDWILLKEHSFQDSNGEYQSQLIINYFITDRRSYDYFVQFLSDNKFQKNVIKDVNGKTSEMWNGTRSLNEQLKFVVITQESGLQKISIM